MDATDPEVERIAADLIAKHGPQAARVAAERLNRMIDRSDTRGRDLWACVVHAIHELRLPVPTFGAGVPVAQEVEG